ncbi:FAD-dependent oxidoreductase [Promicromonospora thailandica]|uniref:Thioredoxin reductase (NADPH) n=1 Tax=Promicromonospora thailandica TaxID=765201 RepID=A0A9X2JX38_9MICO|nr:FAD-dependent oxidoreductase [Promicromonospora thailandica]MCP2267270.1 thioredoxin reductase (NADPH) [Promicromonospora thailandica]BFF20874.1 FAD-dependent oxidoreductase [Promicromonospora thailandica]
MTSETDLVIIGGGPAGCAAAVMAASVGLTSTIIEPRARLGGALWRIATIDNALGGHRTGPDLAAAVLADVERAAPDIVHAAVTRIDATDHSVSVTLASGRQIKGKHAIVATGVAPIQPHDAPWIMATTPMRLSPLWDADAAGAVGQTWLVLGADRPLGTFLRANPALDVKLLVPHPPSDSYKTDEVADDPRVTLIPVDALMVDDDLVAQPGNLRGDQTFTNIGVAPVAIHGLVHDADGYCPIEGQHPRVHIAGDLRSSRGQRVQTAMGSGAEAALSAYYAGRS